ncbi:hypothetical protein L2E82_03201 [Cichorium intybus]|uniref:Uncharacterized protein n=1 Tax=Cichorium intybus TaxID=13427 RepID=A0ACB9H3F2_CICIN|nr:hypothetical protein L2E82_03201 [Cichorium intybus]
MVGHTLSIRHESFFLVRLAVVSWGGAGWGGVLWFESVRCGVKVKEGAPGFWALVNGISAVEQHFVVVFFFTKVHVFLWDFRIPFLQVDLFDTSNCTSFSNFNENEG